MCGPIHCLLTECPLENSNSIYLKLKLPREHYHLPFSLWSLTHRPRSHPKCLLSLSLTTLSLAGVKCIPSSICCQPQHTTLSHPLFILVWKTASFKTDLFILLSSCHPQINFLKLHHDTSMLTPVAFHCLQKSLNVISYDHDPLPPYFFLVIFPHHPSTVCILGLKNN